MSTSLRPVGDVLRLERIPVEPDPSTEYVSIGVRSYGKGIFRYEPKPGHQLGSLRFFELHPNRLVISNIKGWEGAIAVSAAADANTVASNRFLTYVPIDDEIDVRWARWYFLSERGIAQIQRASPGSADRNRTLAINRFEALQIPLPPINEQRRVALALDRIMEGSSNTARLAARLATLSAAFAVSLTSRPDLSESVKLSKGWRRLPLHEVVDGSGVTTQVQPSERYRIAGIYSFGRGLIDRGWITGAETSYRTLTTVQLGDIVLSKLNGWEGAIAVVDKRFDGFSVSSEYPVFAPRRGVATSEYLAGIAASPAFWDSLDASARGSMVRRRRISPTEFLATHVWIPPLDVQARVAITLSAMGKIAAERERAVARITALVPSALNRAFAELT